LQIVDQITGTTIDFGALRPEDLVWDPLAQTARWDLSRLIIAPTFYNLILDARSIFDISGTTLDGDGNGVPGDDYVQTVLVALQGDASLDGCVDGSDFIIWNSHKFSNGSWLQGDFNHDSIVDGSDFVLWNRFKFTCLAATTAFPGTTAEHVGIADLSSVVGSPAISPMEEHHDLPTRRDSVFESIKPVHHVVALEAINRPWRECDLPQAAWGRSKVMRSLELNQSHSSEDEYAEFTRLVDCVFGS
jgi:hypothetical protein